MYKIFNVIIYFIITFFCNISLYILKITVIIAVFLSGFIVICSFGIKEFVELLHIVDDEGGWC